MERQIVNPWTWQEQFGYVQAHVVTGAERTIYCAGVASVDDDGNPLHEGDMTAQAGKSFDNLETLLRESGASLADVVRLNYYTTDIDGFFGAMEVIGPRLAKAGCQPTSTLLEVVRLALQPLLIEIEATAVT